jgi:hypothetical protein
MRKQETITRKRPSVASLHIQKHLEMMRPEQYFYPGCLASLMKEVRQFQSNVSKLSKDNKIPKAGIPIFLKSKQESNSISVYK